MAEEATTTPQPNKTQTDATDRMVSSLSTLEKSNSTIPLGNGDQKNSSKAKLSSEELTKPLQDQDWRELEERFIAKIEDLKVKEQGITDDYAAWTKVM